MSTLSTVTADASTIIGSVVAVVGTLIVGFGVYYLTVKNSEASQRRTNRVDTYVSMLLVIDHILAAADAVAPMEGDFGSLLEVSEMTAIERSRISAEVRTHGSRATRTDFTYLMQKFGELQKWSMHMWDVHDRSKFDPDLAISDTYGLDTIGELRDELRTVASRLEVTVRRELHGEE